MKFYVNIWKLKLRPYFIFIVTTKTILNPVNNGEDVLRIFSWYFSSSRLSSPSPSSQYGGISTSPEATAFLRSWPTLLPSTNKRYPLRYLSKIRLEHSGQVEEPERHDAYSACPSRLHHHQLPVMLPYRLTQFNISATDWIMNRGLDSRWIEHVHGVELCCVLLSIVICFLGAEGNWLDGQLHSKSLGRGDTGENNSLPKYSKNPAPSKNMEYSDRYRQIRRK